MATVDKNNLRSSSEEENGSPIQLKPVDTKKLKQQMNPQDYIINIHSKINEDKFFEHYFRTEKTSSVEKFISDFEKDPEDEELFYYKGLNWVARKEGGQLTVFAQKDRDGKLYPLPEADLVVLRALGLNVDHL